MLQASDSGEAYVYHFDGVDGNQEPNQGPIRLAISRLLVAVDGNWRVGEQSSISMA